MKNFPVDRPRFTCRIIRGSRSVLGDTTAGAPRGFGAAHIAACADCQSFFGACDELERALKRDAAREWREPPSGLEQNIIRAVRLSTPEPAPRHSRRTLLSLAGATACAAVAVLVYQQRTSSPGTPAAAQENLAVNAVDPATLAEARQIIAAVPADLFAQMQPRAQAILQQNPLQNEVDAVAADARSAVQFLALNFMPTPAAGQSSGE